MQLLVFFNAILYLFSCMSTSLLVVFSLTRHGGDRVFPASGWASCSLEFTLWRKFPGVQGCPQPHWLPHCHLLRHLCVCGGHNGQFLPRFYSPLLPAPQQGQQRRWGGREWLMGGQGKRKRTTSNCESFTKKNSCSEVLLVSQIKLDKTWEQEVMGRVKSEKKMPHQESSHHVKPKIILELSWESHSGLGDVRYPWIIVNRYCIYWM